MLSVVVFASCQDTETYAEQRDKENDTINAYIRDNNIKVISESQFKANIAANQAPTDTTKNEYVLIESTGVYMQICEVGSGETFTSGSKTILCRFKEASLFRSSKEYSWLTNMAASTSFYNDKMYVTCTSGTYTASFEPSRSLMYQAYSSASVPSAWLAALPYIKLGRYTSEKGLAKVRLIVPHGQGNSTASQYVVPYFYEITYELGAK